jgi:hypothetical protein
MKKLLTTLFLLMTLVTFSQKTPKTPKVDSTEICFPYQVGQKILFELNECDKNKELLKLDSVEIKLLNDKIKEKDGVINDLNKTVQICDTIIKKNEEKFKIVDDENKNLRKDVNLLKLRNNISNIVSGVIITGLTYIFIFK